MSGVGLPRVTVVYFQTYSPPPLSSRENLRFRSLFALFPPSNAGGSVPSHSLKLYLSNPPHLNNPRFYAKIQHYSTILFMALPSHFLRADLAAHQEPKTNPPASILAPIFSLYSYLYGPRRDVRGNPEELFGLPRRDVRGTPKSCSVYPEEMFGVV